MKRKSIAALVATPANRQFIITLTLAVTALISGSQVQGAVKIWVGNTSADLAGSTNYTTANAPVSGDSFVFGAAGTAGVALTNGLAATFSTVGITFNPGAAAYTMSGNAMVLTGNILNGSTALQTINFNLSTIAVRTVTTTTGGGGRCYPQRYNQRLCRWYHQEWIRHFNS